MESNLRLRILSSLFLAIIIGLVIYVRNYAFCALVVLTAMLEYQEWQNMTKQKSSFLKSFLQIIGLIVIVLFNTSMLYIYTKDVMVFFWLGICVVSNDIFAYCFGRYFKGYKLLPIISPNKTWSGFFGGLLASLIFGSAFAFFTGLGVNFIALSAIVSVLATVGDILESLLKRCCSFKDSGAIIPGHGGILDRVDGFLISAPFVAYVLIY